VKAGSNFYQSFFIAEIAAEEKKRKRKGWRKMKFE
jgi:hypothetical protein